MTGTLEGTLWGAFSAVTFYGIGQKFGGSLGEGMGVMGSGYSKAGLARATAAHGVAGGTLSKLQGGRFGHGLASAGITKIASPAIEFAANDDSFAEASMATIAGGSISSISGGKFANGAVTAAMAYAFNSLAHHRRAPTEEDAIEDGIENSREVRRKANDLTRKDHPHYSYRKLANERIGGAVIHKTKGHLWWREDLFFAPREYDFLYGSAGFNSRYGGGYRMTGFMGGYINEGNIKALIVKIPDHWIFSETFGADASNRFGGVPVYVIQGTSQNVLRYQYDMNSGQVSCSMHSGSVSC